MESTRAYRLFLGAAAAGAGILSVSAALAAEITVWSWGPEFNGVAMEQAATAYKATHPGDSVKVTYFDKGALEQKLQTQLASGNTQGLPDIVLIEDYGAQKYLQAFPGAFEALNDKIDYSKFAAYKVALSSLDGKTYSVPFDSGVTGLFYRIDYLAAAGFKPADLENISWDRFIEIAKAVKEKTGHKMIDQDISSPDLIKILLQSTGSWFFDKDGKPDIVNNAGLKASLAMFQKLMTSGIDKPVSGWTEYVAGFNSGEVASVVQGAWLTAVIKSNADLAGKWGVAPIPALEGVPGAVHASNQGGSSWYVLSSAKSKDAAVSFLSSVWAGNADFYQGILTQIGAVGSYLPARAGAAYQANDAYFSGQPVWENFSKWLAEVPSVNYGLYTNEVLDALKAQMPALVNGQSVDDALKAMNDQVVNQIQ